MHGHRVGQFSTIIVNVTPSPWSTRVKPRGPFYACKHARTHPRVFVDIRAGIPAEDGGCYLALDSVTYQTSCEARHDIFNHVRLPRNNRTPKYLYTPPARSHVTRIRADDLWLTPSGPYLNINHGQPPATMIIDYMYMVMLSSLRKAQLRVINEVPMTMP
jgi:hypothetical protein